MKVKQYLKKINIEVQICCFTSGEELVYSNKYFDIIVMDIKMNGINGMEAVRLLRSKGKNSQVIFVTFSKEYVFEAFDVDAIHYLLKPVTDEDLFLALDKAIGKTEQKDSQTITISKGSTIQIIPIRDILFCEAVDHKIYINTTRGKIDYYGKMDTLQKQLDNRFFRCHRSYIVNMNFVSGKEQDSIRMTNGEKVLVSRRKRQAFTQQLLAFIRNEVL